MRRTKTSSCRTTAAMAAALALTVGCASKDPPTSPPCEQSCKDGVALRALREVMKYVYNGVVQNSPVGPQNGTLDRFVSGSARVSGYASADPLQGVTTVNLTYVFTKTRFSHKDDSPNENYDVVVDGKLWQNGKIAVQPSSTTSLCIGGTDVQIVGQVYDPPLNYRTEPSNDAGVAEPTSYACTGAYDAGDDGPSYDAGDAKTPDDAGDAETPDDAGDTEPPDDAGEAPRCAVKVTQNGNDVSGIFCRRSAGFSF